MIYFHSSHTSFGGSTLAISRVVQLLNDHGVPARFYGGHTWFTKLSPHNRAEPLPPLLQDDVLVTHYIDLKERPHVRKSILWLHEETFMMEWGLYCCWACNQTSKQKIVEKGSSLRVCPSCCRRTARYQRPVAFDRIVFVSDAHEKKSKAAQIHWGPSIVIHNPIEVDFDWDPPSVPTAGVIGTIEPRKRTHESIAAAKAFGFSRILLYGGIEPVYFEQRVKPLLDDNVRWMGLCEDREKMYRSVSAVFLHSGREQASLVQGECRKLGIPFHGSAAVMPWDLHSDETIVKAWKELLT